jgi:diguanylate cyclase
LKVDRSFVAGLGESREDTAIVVSLIKLAHDLGMTVVAEGVETAQQLSALRHAGCDIGQGFYFSRPQPAEAVHDLLLARWELVEA